MAKLSALGIVALGVVVLAGCGSRPAPEEAVIHDGGLPERVSSLRRQTITGHLSPELTRAPVLSRVPVDTVLPLTIHLVVPDMLSLRAAVRGASDPKSPLFRRYLTAEQFGDRFGVSPTDYERVAAWATAHHLVVERYHNRLAMSLQGRVGDVESALHVHLNYASRADGTRFYAPDAEPSADLEVPIAHISNLDDYQRPRSADRDGTGPSGNYLGSDLRIAYLANYPSSYGSGQVVAIANDQSQCFNQADIDAYRTVSGLPANVNHEYDVTAIDITTPCPSGKPTSDYTENTLDIEMVTAMAPEAKIVVFGRATANGTLSDAEMYLDIVEPASGPPPPTVTSSYFPPNSSWSADDGFEAILDQMALQGQSFLEAAGDNGAYSSTNAPYNLTEVREQAVTVVGGTELIMNQSGEESYVSEYAWTNGGGGLCTNPGSLGMAIPWYQETAAKASGSASVSTVFRNAPDVSAVADDIYISIGGGWAGKSGTSAAAPLWAGIVALANAESVAAGKPTLGFLNPVLYGMASASSHSSFNDITTGCNPTVCYTGQSVDAGTCVKNDYCASSGYDLATGLGTPGPALVGYLGGASAWQWTRLSTSGGPTTITSVVGAPPGTAYTAWALDDTVCSGCGSYDHQLWHLSTSGAWGLVPVGGGVQVAVDPSGHPWTVNHNGTVFYSAALDGTALSPLTTGAVAMLQIAPGPQNSSGPTAWALSKTMSGSDYVVWSYNVQTANSWAVASPSGAGLSIAAAPDTGWPWLLNHNGTLFQGFLQGFAWDVITNDQSGSGGPASPDGGQYFGWQGKATSVGIGPNNQAWLVNNLPSVQDSSDYQIFNLAQLNSYTDSAWSLVAGGAQRVTVSSSGIPWILDHSGNASYGVPGWSYGGGLEGDAY